MHVHVVKKRCSSGTYGSGDGVEADSRPGVKQIKIHSVVV